MERKGIVLLVLAGLVGSGLAFRASVHAPPPRRAFYYWKTTWSGSPAVIQRLARNRIDRLYLRLFDVQWDELDHAPEPVAELRLEGSLPSAIDIVPVVYLTNEVFLKGEYRDAERLADHVRDKVASIATGHRLPFSELQVDCDWSDGSRRAYFHFVDLLARKLAIDRKTVSTTLRLHQIKYFDRTGVPPVPRGMLMLYNFGRIEADGTNSSIFNAADARRYSRYIANYPLPLDVVLPAFSWSIHSREGRVLGLLEHVTADDVASFDGFRKIGTNGYEAARSFFFRGRYFMAGDHLQMETITPELTREAALVAKQGAGFRKSYGTVALFDLDDKRSKQYSGADVDRIFSSF